MRAVWGVVGICNIEEMVLDWCNSFFNYLFRLISYHFWPACCTKPFTQHHKTFFCKTCGYHVLHSWLARKCEIRQIHIPCFTWLIKINPMEFVILHWRVFHIHGAWRYSDPPSKRKCGKFALLNTSQATKRMGWRRTINGKTHKPILWHKREMK